MMTFKVYDVNIKIALLLVPMILLSIFMNLTIELIMLLCIVFAHELAHCFAAKLFNVRIMEIEIFPLGGVVKMENELSLDPFKEIIVAFAGPAINFIMILFAFVILNKTYYSNSTYNIFLIMNLSIGVFNCLPIIPLDGGRIFRALLTYMCGFKEATLIAVKLGKIIAVFIFLIGIYMTIMYEVEYLYVIVLSLFLYRTTNCEKKTVNYLMFREVLMKKTMLIEKGIMNAKHLTVVDSVKAGEIIGRFSSKKYHLVTVLDSEGKLLAHITESEILNTISKYGGNITIRGVAEIIHNEKQLI
ncbi:MAG: hypothetical protein COA82_06285 [Alkaliphilus sp.]|nr:MAG: hypothetical protein COA82_06285 [Alkaliphilus sp.]